MQTLSHLSRKMFVLGSLILLTGIAAPPAMADSMSDIKQRFIERKDEILDLLKSGKAGENYYGLLEKRESLSAAQAAIIEAENADRKKVYASLAKKNGTDVNAVGALRAEDIRQQLPKGVWVQNKSGDWVKT